MLDEEKWLGITQGFQALRESSAETRESELKPDSITSSNNNLRKNGISQIEEPFDDGSCNKENEVGPFDEQRKKRSQIPQSRITGVEEQFEKSPFFVPISVHKRNESRPRKRTDSKTVEMTMDTGESKIKVDKLSKYLDLNQVQQMEVKLRESNRRLGEKSRQVEAQKRLISQLREMLRVIQVPETIQDVDHMNHMLPEGNLSNNSSESKTENTKKDASILLDRLEKIEEKIDTLINNLPEKIETVCIQVLRRELGETDNQQPKWNPLPSIKPKSNLAAKLRINCRSGVQLDCNGRDKEDNIEQKVARLESVVEQLKQSMIKILLNAKKCSI